MLKSEMQHQFWITKKSVQRKFGSKEDEHIISSDSELDAKIEIFKSISATSAELYKIVDQYQEKLCMLSREECMFGRFLKETGKRSKTTGQTIANAGKAVSFCGQQRMCVHVPLLRLQHEVNVFRYRAITDMQNTISIMEKERTVYRAALEWMKSASTELDPDTGRGLEKFRTAQSHVRNAKQIFDCLTLDSIQKIDLLAAARCNMFSHVLVSYMLELKQFAQKTNTLFETISKALEQKPKFDFCILKELTQHEEGHGIDNDNKTSFDTDQYLFFTEDYKDNIEPTINKRKIKDIPDDNLVQICSIPENIMDFSDKNQNAPVKIENKKIGVVNEKTPNMFTNLLFPKQTTLIPTFSYTEESTNIKSKEFESNKTLESLQAAKKEEIKSSKNLKANSWIDLFADLDPLTNLEAFDLKLSGDSRNFQQT